MKTGLANLVAQSSLADIEALAKMKAKQAKLLPKLQRQREKLAAKLECFAFTNSEEAPWIGTT